MRCALTLVVALNACQAGSLLERAARSDYLVVTPKDPKESVLECARGEGIQPGPQRDEFVRVVRLMNLDSVNAQPRLIADNKLYSDVPIRIPDLDSNDEYDCGLGRQVAPVVRR